MSDETRKMTIYFTNGEQLALSYATQADSRDAVSKAEQALAKNQLIVELPDRVMVIPFGSVQRIEIDPVPDNLPAYAIRGAETL